MKFNHTLSFDGVAIVIACVTSCVWFGVLSNRVSNAEKILDDHTSTLKVLAEGQNQTAKNLAALQQLVQDKIPIQK